MSILDEIRAAIGEALSDPELFFSAALLTRAAGDGGGWTDDAATAQTFPCLAMIDTYTDHLRAVADIPDTHVKLMIIGTSITVDPLKADTVAIDGASWRIMGPVQKDPAGAIWTAQAVPV
jgi:hypothetical protein